MPQLPSDPRLTPLFTTLSTWDGSQTTRASLPKWSARISRTLPPLASGTSQPPGLTSALHVLPLLRLPRSAPTVPAPTNTLKILPKNGTEYLLLSVYKNYIHVEPLTDRSGPRLCAAYAATHMFFRKHGHHVRVQIILDNETFPALLSYFDSENILYQLVPPVQKRTNTAERAIQTFRRHFLRLLATTHPSFPINHWPALLPLTANLMRAYSDLHSISA
jgi:hypothetical protein